ncbi:unnamed protein product [Tenebrio molitor]|nr:unnamed protein product [Tenebrio molitor]
MRIKYGLQFFVCNRTRNEPYACIDQAAKLNFARSRDYLASAASDLGDNFSLSSSKYDFAALIYK